MKRTGGRESISGNVTFYIRSLITPRFGVCGRGDDLEAGAPVDTDGQVVSKYKVGLKRWFQWGKAFAVLRSRTKLGSATHRPVTQVLLQGAGRRGRRVGPARAT